MTPSYSTGHDRQQLLGAPRGHYEEPGTHEHANGHGNGHYANGHGGQRPYPGPGRALEARGYLETLHMVCIALCHEGQGPFIVDQALSSRSPPTRAPFSTLPNRIRISRWSR
jgi:hypothetical protein